MTKIFKCVVCALLGIIIGITATFGAMTAGLVSNAGVGLAVLFKNTKEIKRNLILVGVLYALGVIAGFIVSLIVAATGVAL